MSFYQLPHPWDPGYAIPEYIKAEPPERGVFTTKWLPRGTISQLVPDFLAKPVMGLGATVYELEPMGADDGAYAVRRPVDVYGQRVSEWIANTILGVPAEYRKAALRALLDTLDEDLWSKVAMRMERAVARGVLPREAMREALASSMSEGMLAELTKAGKVGQVDRVSQLGLGMYDGAQQMAQYQALDRFYELGGLWDDVKSAAKRVGRAVVDAPKTIVEQQVAATKLIGSKAKSAGKAIGGAAADAAKWVVDGVKTVGKYACKAAGSLAGAAPAAAAAGGPYGMAAAGAVTVASGICGGSGPIAPPLPPPTPSTPGWVLPAAIGGGALVLMLALRK